MSKAVLIYPHQLFAETEALVAAKTNGWQIYLVEEPLLLTHNPIHRQKLQFHKLSMDAYERRLVDVGHSVTRLTIADHPASTDVFARLQKDGVAQMHIIDTSDDYLEQAITRSGIDRVWYESPLFLLEKQDAIERYQNSNRFMASFYKQLRQDKNILIDENGKPRGGQWSFDADNRQKIPNDTPLPEEIGHFGNAETTAAADWTTTVDAEQYGELGCWLPYTHDGAAAWLQDFLKERLATFGPYEDAMHTEGIRLWHAALSPLLNVGLLTPQQVLNEVLAYADTHDVPLNSLEGFIRQLIGWREFIRASYECDGRTMRGRNFFNHERDLPDSFWTGTTGLDPVDHTIRTALTYGYSHHIERLMVMGNIMLLSQLHPDEVYRWFMGMYVDAYDWVMVPNVYGMSQFADGGNFATKPYISGANYIKKMSNFQRGEWEDTWTALYWHFIAEHEDYFKSNHRLSMMPRTLARMKPETRKQHMTRATLYLDELY